MVKKLKQNKLSKYQQKAIFTALYEMKSTTREEETTKKQMKWLLLRAFVIYKRHNQLSPEALSIHKSNFRRRLKIYLKQQSKNKIVIPYYLFAFLEKTFQEQKYLPDFLSNYDYPFSSKIEDSDSQRRRDNANRGYSILFSCYHQAWINLVRTYLAIVTKNSHIGKLKNKLGCISLIPVKVGNEHIKVRDVCINYHDLYHLEVAQLERILMGKDWVSGIHGIKTEVFHDSTIVEEYDSFLDEARIAIHEGLTRTTPFSVLKTLCWMTLLILQGINPVAVLLRHIKSMNIKQKEFRSMFVENDLVGAK